jgi:hypothetical protein
VSVTWRDVGAEDGLTFNSDERLGLTVTSNTLPRYKKAQSAGQVFIMRILKMNRTSKTIFVFSGLSYLLFSALCFLTISVSFTPSFSLPSQEAKTRLVY